MPEVTYAAEKVHDPEETFDLWHAVASTEEVNKVPHVNSTCGLRFRPVDVITEQRTLIDWAEEDNLCGCAAVMPSDEQCKAAGVQLQIGGTSMTEDDAKRLIEENHDYVTNDPFSEQRIKS